MPPHFNFFTIAMALTNFTYTLTWSDFNQVPSKPPGAAEDAAIKVRYSQNYNYGSNKNAVVISSADVDITCTPECWVVSSAMSNDLLQHEQGHFDITALGAREFYNSLLQLKASNGKEIKAKISALNTKVQGKIDRANKRYDKQTGHSQQANMQQLWEQKIATELKKMDGSLDNLP